MNYYKCQRHEYYHYVIMWKETSMQAGQRRSCIQQHLDIMHPQSRGGDKVTTSALSQWMCVLWHIKNALFPQTAAGCSTRGINRWPAHIRWPLSLSGNPADVSPAYVCASLWHSEVCDQPPSLLAEPAGLEQQREMQRLDVELTAGSLDEEATQWHSIKTRRSAELRPVGLIEARGALH